MSQYAQKILYFYCHTCKDYELKTSPRYRRRSADAQRRRPSASTKPRTALIQLTPDEKTGLSAEH